MVEEEAPAETLLSDFRVAIPPKDPKNPEDQKSSTGLLRRHRRRQYDWGDIFRFPKNPTSALLPKTRRLPLVFLLTQRTPLRSRLPPLRKPLNQSPLDFALRDSSFLLSRSECSVSIHRVLSAVRHVHPCACTCSISARRPFFVCSAPLARFAGGLLFRARKSSPRPVEVPSLGGFVRPSDVCLII